jgi:hypothetical protein
MLSIAVAMEMLLRSNGDVQISNIALVIDVRNMWNAPTSLTN